MFSPFHVNKIILNHWLCYIFETLITNHKHNRAAGNISPCFRLPSCVTYSVLEITDWDLVTDTARGTEGCEQ